MADAAPPHPPRRHAVHRAILRHARTLHTYLSMLAAVLFLFFGATGFMLNHPGWFHLDDTRTVESTFTVPPGPIAAKDKLAVVELLRAHGATGAVQPFDWPGEGEPFSVAFKSPRSQCDADITLPTGETKLSVQTHGIAGLITRLHTARDAGRAWQLLLDATAVLLVLTCVTGLILWQSLPKRRTLGMAGLVLSVLAVGLAYWMCVP
jgi:hypothetical protein